MLTSRSSEWDRGRGGRNCPFPLVGLALVFAHCNQRHSRPTLRYLCLCFIDSFSLILWNNTFLPGTTVRGWILGRWTLDATLTLVHGMWGPGQGVPWGDTRSALTENLLDPAGTKWARHPSPSSCLPWSCSKVGRRSCGGRRSTRRAGLSLGRSRRYVSGQVVRRRV